MKSRNVFRLVAACLAGASLFAAGSSAPAPDPGLSEISFDPAKTQIKWELDGAIHNTHGTFRLKQGHISLDPRTGVASGEVLVDATTGESSDSVRDHRMQKDVLESLKYPEIRFIPQRVDGKLAPQGKSSLMISGLFEVHGKQHAITVPAEVNVDGNQLSGTVRFEIPYVDWGMKDPSTFILRVDKTVKIELDAHGQIAQ